MTCGICISKQQVTSATRISYKEVIKHWEDTYKDDTFDGDYERGETISLEDLQGFEWWELKKIPLAKIIPHHDMPDYEKVGHYTRMRDWAGTKFPAIILVPKIEGKYKTLDGVHRYWAAKEAGDKTMLAYVPVGTKK